MKKFYISSMEGHSAIAVYTRDFYRLVLKERGYIFMNSNESTVNMLSAISSQDHVHIEIGILQKKEIEILFLMLRANYKKVVVTLHDAPFIKFPFYEFKNNFLNKISGVYDRYTNGFGAINQYVQRIKSIYVLSKNGLEAVKKKYKVTNAYYLPHIIDLHETEKSEKKDTNFIYSGCISRESGLEYCLKLHQKIAEQIQSTSLYIAGYVPESEKEFYKNIQQKYDQNVHYLGNIPEDQLTIISAKATFALLFFKRSSFLQSHNSTILYGLKQGKILFTNRVNAISEFIKDGKNGFYLSGNLKRDVNTLKKVFDNRSLLETIKKETHNYLLTNHSAEVVKNKLND